MPDITIDANVLVIGLIFVAMILVVILIKPGSSDTTSPTSTVSTSSQAATTTLIPTTTTPAKVEPLSNVYRHILTLAAPTGLGFTIYKTQPITIPVGETWTYTMTCYLGYGNTGNNTRPEYNFDITIWLWDDTNTSATVATKEKARTKVYTGAYGGPMHCIISVELTSANIPAGNTNTRVYFRLDETGGAHFSMYLASPESSGYVDLIKTKTGELTKYF